MLDDRKNNPPLQRAIIVSISSELCKTVKLSLHSKNNANTNYLSKVIFLTCANAPASKR